MPLPNVSQTGYSYGPSVKFKTEDVLPPSAVYVGPDDSLILSVRNPSFPTTVNLSYRLLMPDGTLQTEIFQFAAASVGAAPATLKIDPTEGYLISASASAPAASRGQVFVKFFLQRGVGSADVALGQVLMQDYVSLDDFIGYPQSPLSSSLNGRGWTRQVTFAAAGAGAGALQIVPAGVQWLMKSIVVSFTTSAAVANRVVNMSLVFPVITVAALLGPFATQAASLTRIYTFAPGAVGLAVGQYVMQGMPQTLIAPPGASIKVDIDAIDAADQINVVRILIEEFVAQ